MQVGAMLPLAQQVDARLPAQAWLEAVAERSNINTLRAVARRQQVVDTAGMTRFEVLLMVLDSIAEVPEGGSGDGDAR